jgi:hypothetical protein
MNLEKEGNYIGPTYKEKNVEIDSSIVKGDNILLSLANVYYEVDELKDTQILTTNSNYKLEELTLSDGSTFIRKKNNLYVLEKDIKWGDVVGINPTTEYIIMKDDTIFDGNGYTIDLESNTTSGLFEAKCSSYNKRASILNLGVINGDTVYNSGGSYFLRSRSYNYLIDSCYSTGPIRRDCGGIAGKNNCLEYNNPTKCIIRNCYSTGDLLDDRTGGILGLGSCGYGSTVIIENCYVTGRITNNNSGGIVTESGYSGSKLYINNCYSISTQVHNSSSTGCIFGVWGSNEANTVCIISNSYCNNYRLCGGYNCRDGGSMLLSNVYAVSSLTNGSSPITEPYQSTLYKSVLHNTYGMSDVSYNTSKKVVINSDVLKVNYILDDIYGSLHNINESYVADVGEPVEFSNEGGAYILDNSGVLEYPLLKAFKESDKWNGEEYNNYDDTPTLKKVHKVLEGDLNNVLSYGILSYNETVANVLFNIIPNVEVYDYSYVSIRLENDTTRMDLSYNKGINEFTLNNVLLGVYNYTISLVNGEGYFVGPVYKDTLNLTEIINSAEPILKEELTLKISSYKNRLSNLIIDLSINDIYEYNDILIKLTDLSGVNSYEITTTDTSNIIIENVEFSNYKIDINLKNIEGFYIGKNYTIEKLINEDLMSFGIKRINTVVRHYNNDISMVVLRNIIDVNVEDYSYNKIQIRLNDISNNNIVRELLVERIEGVRIYDVDMNDISYGTYRYNVVLMDNSSNYVGNDYDKELIFPDDLFTNTVEVISNVSQTNLGMKETTKDIRIDYSILEEYRNNNIEIRLVNKLNSDISYSLVI